MCIIQYPFTLHRQPACHCCRCRKVRSTAPFHRTANSLQTESAASSFPPPAQTKCVTSGLYGTLCPLNSTDLQKWHSCVQTGDARPAAHEDRTADERRFLRCSLHGSLLPTAQEHNNCHGAYFIQKVPGRFTGWSVVLFCCFCFLNCTCTSSYTDIIPTTLGCH